MARTYSRPWRTLAALGAIMLALIGIIAAGVTWNSAQWTPKLALDLDGGTEFVLKAVPEPGQAGAVTTETMTEAVKIIRQRVNGTGVSEAEVTTHGQDSIIVSLPGRNIDETTKNAIRRSAAMQFRPVIFIEQPATPTPSASASAGASASASASGSATTKVSASPVATSSSASVPAASSSASGAGLKLATPSASPTTVPTTTPTAVASASAAAGASAAASPAASAAPKPTDASDENWLQDPELNKIWPTVDCTTAAGRTKAQAMANDATKPMVACDDNGYKFVLGPVEVFGKDITKAVAGMRTTSQGATLNEWVVDLEFNGTGAAAFAKVTQRLQPLEGVRNQFAIVLDNQVISAPTTNSVIADGRAEISGSFTQESSTQLANQLKFGALPISFKVANESDISATLGSEQLQKGLLAGLIGLILVVLYSLLQYRALGLVTVGSLVIAGALTYLVVVLLGWRQGYRLSMAGIAGLIVAIGITADSFIVYFERIRDEVREGRSLQTAVELAWQRARHTILISDGVSLLAAVVLYVLAVGGVRGFAFTLGLTTVIDVLVVFMFTKPLVTLLARTHFFGGGHKLSGFDADHLGRQVTYTGRGGVRTPSTPRTPAASTSGQGTIAERRAAAERASTTTTAVMEEKD